MMRPRAGVLMLVAVLAACGASGTEPNIEPEPDTIDPGPADVVLVRVTELANYDLRTELENEGGSGSFKVALFGWDPLAPCNGCNTRPPLGESDATSIDADYAEVLTWDSGPTHRFTRVIVYSRPSNSAAWTETDRWDAP